MPEIQYPAPGDASPDNPQTIRRVNDENRTDVRQPVKETPKPIDNPGNNPDTTLDGTTVTTTPNV